MEGDPFPPWAQRVYERLPLQTWVPVGLIGLVVFGLAIYAPAFRHVPDAGLVESAIAVLGAAVAVLGFSFYLDGRAYLARHPPPSAIDVARSKVGASFEVYDPRDRNRPVRRRR